MGKFPKFYNVRIRASPRLTLSHTGTPEKSESLVLGLDTFNLHRLGLKLKTETLKDLVSVMKMGL